MVKKVSLMLQHHANVPGKSSMRSETWDGSGM